MSESAYIAKRAIDPEDAAYDAQMAAARDADQRDTVLGNLKQTGKEVLAGLKDPKALGRNALIAGYDAVRNAASMVGDAMESAGNAAGGPGTKVTVVPPDFILEADALRARAERDSTGGDVFTQKALQFAVPFMSAMKASGAVTALGTFDRALASDAAVSATVWAPHEGRFADLIQELAPNAPVMGPMIDYLASDPSDSNAEGRFKNMLDSQLAGAAFGSFLWVGAKTLRAARYGTLKSVDVPAKPEAK